MARAGVNPPSGPPPPPARVPARRRPPPLPRRRSWVPAAVVVVLAALVVAAVAGFVLTRSGDSDVPEDAFTDACSIVGNAAISKAVRYNVGKGAEVTTAPPLSGCTFAPSDPDRPPIGVIVTDDARNADSFDRTVLSASYPSIESVQTKGAKGQFLSRESGPETTDALLVVTDENRGVEVSISGQVSPNEAFNLSRHVAELYTSRLGIGD